MKEEKSSPDAAGLSRPLFGGPGKMPDGEGAPRFRRELAQNLDAYTHLNRCFLTRDSLFDHSVLFEALPFRVLPTRCPERIAGYTTSSQ